MKSTNRIKCLSCGWRGEAQDLEHLTIKLQASPMDLGKKACPLCKSIAVEKIRHNYYLNHCYKSLNSQGGDLVIFGTSLKSNDDHIAKAIIAGKWDNVYAGAFSDDDVRSLLSLKERIVRNNKANTRRKQTTFTLYDAKTVNPWGNND